VFEMATELRSWEDISPDEVKGKVSRGEDVQFIDVRELEEYKEGHIPTVKLLPLSQLDVRFDELDKDKEVVCICRSGNRSAKACQFLSSRGYKQLKNMAGGMLEWNREVERV
jgi:rhodanese-related sulfurtransferase